jgi:class 3 adenylate cyclase/CHASE2 domain-containing sensor protein
MNEVRRKKRKPSGFLLHASFGIAAALIALAVSLTSFFQSVELKFLDLRFTLRPALPRYSGVVHIDIDDASIERIGKWPWDRRRHAQAIDVLSECGSDAIIMDIEISEPAGSELASGTELTEKLLSCVRSAKEAAQKGGEDEHSIALTLSAAEEIITDLQRQDRQLAASVARSGRVYLAFSMPLQAPGAREIGEEIWYPAARDFLTRNPDASAEDISRAIGVREEEIAPLVTRLKESVIYETVRRKVISDPSINLEQVLASFQSGESVKNRFLLSTAERAYKQIIAQITLRQKVPEIVFSSPLPASLSITAPIPELADAAANCGFVTVERERSDFVLRKISLLRSYDGRAYPYLSLIALCDVLHVKRISFAEGAVILESALLPGKDAPETVKIPTDPAARVIVNWAGKRGENVSHVFDHIPFCVLTSLADLRETIAQNFSQPALTSLGWNRVWSDLRRELAILQEKIPPTNEERKDLAAKIAAARQEIEKEECAMLDRAERFLLSARERKDLPQDEKALATSLELLFSSIRDMKDEEQKLASKLSQRVSGKVCVIGSAHTGSTDLHPTPISSELPGAMAHSSLINMVINKLFITPAPRWLNIAMVILISLLCAIVAGYSGALRSALTVGAVLASYAAFSFLLFASGGIWLELAPPLLAGVLGYSSVAAHKRLSEEKSKRQIRKIFQNYVSASVANEILREPDRITLGGEMREASIFFCDIEGFSTISEKLSPEELVALLNEYFTEMTSIIVDQFNGYLDKYEGDAIFAIFGVPVSVKDHAARACLAALTCQERLTSLRQSLRARAKPELKARTGISSGIMVVGNIGSPERFDYTALGDVVNLGQRLDQVNKVFGTSIMVSEETFNLAADSIEARCVGLVRVPGKQQIVKVFEVLARKGELPRNKAQCVRHFEEGLKLYQDRNFTASAECFRKALEEDPPDGPSRFYLDLTLALAGAPPCADWDCTIEIKVK